jgi:lathosterol oxidase
MLPRLVQTWLRNYIATLAMYLILGAVWSYYIYVCFGDDLFPKGNMPSWSAMGDQIKVGQTFVLCLWTPVKFALPHRVA